MTYIVDDKRYGLHVNAAGENIRRYQNLGRAIAEGVDDDIAFTRAKGTRQAGNLVALSVQTSLDLKSGIASLIEVNYGLRYTTGRTNPGKDDGGSNSHQAVKTHEHIVLIVLGRTVKIELLDSFYRQFLVSQRNLVGVWCEAGGKLGDVVWEGGREQD